MLRLAPTPVDARSASRTLAPPPGGPRPDRSGLRLPALAVLSAGIHGLLLLAVTLLPLPSAQGMTAGVIAVDLLPPPAPPPEPVEAEPAEPPPAATEDAAPQRTKRPRRRAREAAPPAPAPMLLTAEGEGGAGDEVAAGSLDGSATGVAGGVAGGVGREATAPAAPVGPQGPTRGELRRLLLGYIRGTLRSYVGERLTYPLAAQREHLEGVVVLRVRLSHQGEILAVRLSRSSGHAVLDRSAVATLQGMGRVPPPPPQLNWEEGRELPVPIDYVLR
ncbi:MAG: energy transducer TonB [Sandaracinaceae bacterium]